MRKVILRNVIHSVSGGTWQITFKHSACSKYSFSKSDIIQPRWMSHARDFLVRLASFIHISLTLYPSDDPMTFHESIFFLSSYRSIPASSKFPDSSQNSLIVLHIRSFLKRKTEWEVILSAFFLAFPNRGGSKRQKKNHSRFGEFFINPLTNILQVVNFKR